MIRSMNDVPYLGGCLAVVVVLVSLGACDSSGSVVAPADKTPGDEVPTAVPTPVQPEPAEEDPIVKVHAHMRGNFVHALLLGNQLVDGNLVEAKVHAKHLADAKRKKELPATWAPFVDQMIAGAKEVDKADDLGTACMAFSDVALACGQCHSTLKAKVVFAVAPVPTGANDMASHMRRHAWGAARIWEGLVGPNDELWDQGAIILAEQPLHESTFLEKRVTKEVVQLSTEMHSVGERGSKARDPKVRAALYGEMLATCARCHSAAGAAKPSAGGEQPSDKTPPPP